MTSNLSPTLVLASELVSRASVTPDDAGCQALIIARLEQLGFVIEPMLFGDVTNLWARRGSQTPLFCFAGHTDVVPTGPEADWTHPPFAAKINKDMLWGRGTADMKGSIAAMITAVERFLKKHPDANSAIAFLITSDEEGIAIDGTVKVIDALEQRNEKIQWCLVGEPSSETKIADTIKNGRRGSLGAKLTVQGIQGHVAYPQLAKNPIHDAMPALAELNAITWDQGNQHFPPTSFQISNINAGTGATNIIPGSLEALFNFRFSTESTPQQLKDRVTGTLTKYELDYAIQWSLSGNPFLTQTGDLLDAAQAAVKTITGYSGKLSTSGGTSDGRFIAPTGAQVIELGPLNATIHKVDEHVSVSDLDTLSAIYEQTLKNLFL